MRDMPSIWVKSDEAAEIMGITVRELYEQVRSGEIPESAVRPRKSKNARLFIKRAFLMGEPSNVVPFNRPIDVEALGKSIATNLASDSAFCRTMMAALLDSFLRDTMGKAS